MPPAVRQFSNEILVIGAIVLSFLAQLVAQHLWNKSDVQRDAIAALQLSLSTLTAKVDTLQRQAEEQSVLLRQVIEVATTRENRLTRVEMTQGHTDKALKDAQTSLSLQMTRLENQVAELHRAFMGGRR